MSKSAVIKVCEKLRDQCSQFSLEDKEITIYNPLEYAWSPFSRYIDECFTERSGNLLLGMNPGPFGMAQSGIPFGDTVLVREFIGIESKVEKPKYEHPKRPIDGFECKRREVSGTRLWSWARDSFKERSHFFDNYFVWNYCPLVFMEVSGANKTPDKLSLEDRNRLFEICDSALSEIISIGKFHTLIGVGKFARKRLEMVAPKDLRIGDILHPSPASPKANKNWVGEVKKSLESLGAPVGFA